MSAHDGRVKHQILHVAISREMLEQFFKDLELTPPGEAFIDGVPVTIFAWQESPLRAGARDPQDGFEEAAAVASGSELTLGQVFSTGRIFCHWSSVSLTVIT